MAGDWESPRSVDFTSFEHLKGCFGLIFNRILALFIVADPIDHHTSSYIGGCTLVGNQM